MYDLRYILNEIEDVERLATNTSVVRCGDNLGGFNDSYNNEIFDQLLTYGTNYSIIYHQYLPDAVKRTYPKFQFIYDPEFQNEVVLKYLTTFEDYQSQKFDNFICSFNGNNHVGRQLLVSALHVREWANSTTVSKDFTTTPEAIDGHVQRIAKNNDRFYLKQFINSSSADYLSTIINLNFRERYNHLDNCYRLSPIIKSCFINIVSEAIATSSVPFVTEKFLYSIVNRSLFVGYAQPLWHEWLCKVYGFRLYDKIFDYRFDTITNPIERLIELLCMLSKFEKLSEFDLHDLYLIVKPQIDFNYNHYKSGDYLDCMEKYAG
jgi:hypothetical protein